MPISRITKIELAIGSPPLPIDPNDSLVDRLEKFYKAMGIANYLDQIGLVDDKIDEITTFLDWIIDGEEQPNPALLELRLMIEKNTN
jgi:hypothetical protein